MYFFNRISSKAVKSSICLFPPSNQNIMNNVLYIFLKNGKVFFSLSLIGVIWNLEFFKKEGGIENVYYDHFPSQTEKKKL